MSMIIGARGRSFLARGVSRRMFLGGAAAAGAAAFLPRQAHAAIPARPTGPVLFTNVRVFDGRSDALVNGSNVLVDGPTIKALQGADAAPEAGVQVIDGGGRILMPGLIDAHWHAMMASLPITVLLTADVGYINLVAGDQAQRTLLRGFTTVRDLSGPAFGVKRAIDSGLIPGPRIFPSGAMISQTGGHGDFRLPYEIPSQPNGPLGHADAIGAGAVADSPDEVRKRAREQLMLGATQLKLAAGGGVSSFYDPIDVSQYTEAEFRAAAEAAENWGTYVTVHAYTPRAIQTAIAGGVRCIDHGQLIDEETADLMAEKDIWLCLQPFLDNEFAGPPSDPARQAKQNEVYAGTDKAYRLAKAKGLKVAWGTDILFDDKMTDNQGAILATLTKWYSPLEILKMATGTNGDLLAMSGPRNPYGRIGVVEAGALADLLLVDGDPTSDISVVADPWKNFRLIMKDGVIFKNTLG